MGNLDCEMKVKLITDNGEVITLQKDNISYLKIEAKDEYKYGKHMRYLEHIQLNIEINNCITFNGNPISKPEDITERLIQYKDIKKIIVSHGDISTIVYNIPWRNSVNKQENLNQTVGLLHPDYIRINISSRRQNKGVNHHRFK